jgi:hypothetical protein
MAALPAFVIFASTTFAAQAATADRLIDRAGPHWLDQTVYQPVCLSNACDCGHQAGSHTESGCAATAR